MRQKARELAISHHGDQQYGDHPYSVHLDAVAKIAQPFGEMAEVVAYLHDVVEDTDITVEQVSAQFGGLVAACVAILSDEPGLDRKESKAITYKKMSLVTGEEELALLVKTADRLANVRACIHDGKLDKLSTYQSEHRVFKQSVYRAGLCDSLWDELNSLINVSD
jgi:(p)ppGpp synthase/HD superfamily hydrolase